MALEDYGALLRSGTDAFNAPVAFQVGLDSEKLQQEQARQQLVAGAEKIARAQQFRRDLETVGANPDAQGISGLMTKYPEFAEQLKGAWDLKDKAVRDADITQLGEIYSAAASGNWDLASKAARARLDADKAAGKTDPADQAFVDAIDSGDAEKRKSILATIGLHLAAATGPEHFATVYGALKGGTHIIPMGGLAIDDTGKTIAHSPLIQDASGNIRLWNDGAGSHPMDEGKPGEIAAALANVPGLSPAVKQVASTLSTALPAPVVAGFMGNFHAEGGYDGAQGDGGSASGIAQWHSDRAAQFEKVVGKPVNEASPEDQAKFVLWEMQNPESAGMTVKQRDQIMAAKTPSQAAALIDKFYERSSGKDRAVRMQAADAFASSLSGSSTSSSGGSSDPFPILIPGKEKPAPSGYAWSPDGKTLVAIPGGPADIGELDDTTTNLFAQQYLSTGQLPPLGMGKTATQARLKIMKQVATIAGGEGLSGKDLATQIAHYKAGVANISNLEKQFGTVTGNEATFAKNAQQVVEIARQMNMTDSRLLNTPLQTYLRQTNDPNVARLDVAIKTAANEYARLVTASPSGAGTLSDSARMEYQGVIEGNFPLKQKIAALRQMQIDASNRTSSLHSALQTAYAHLTDRAPELRGGGRGPVMIHSVQEYNNLRPGTRYIDPNGIPRTKKK